MITTEILAIIVWWAALFLLGLTFLPLTLIIFKAFFDRGYIFSKIIGILLVSYISWILPSLHLVNFGVASLVISPLIFIILNIWLFKKINLISEIKSHRKIFLTEEIIFTLGLVFWAWIKSFEPSIHGLEKFMDFGFINSILRSEYFPPKDLWLTPHSINYYYFGHLNAAFLTKLTSVDPVVSYNLVLSMLFGLTLCGSFSLGSNLFFKYQPQNLLYRYGSGILAALLTTLGGNLHPIYAFFSTYPVDNPVPFWNLDLISNFSAYWYPNATRFIPNTIHEFPIYSFVVSDLHGHVLNIPFVLLFLALAIRFFYLSRITLFETLSFGFLIGIFLMTNVMDGPIYLLLLAMLLCFKKIEGVVIKMTIIVLSAILFTLPFWLNFVPFASGIGILCAPKFLTDFSKIGPFLFEENHCQRTPLWMMLILWGFPMFIFLVHLFQIFFRKGKKVLLNLQPVDQLVLILGLFSLLLIIIPELVYAKDIYPAHYRANTVFKFGYQAFMIFSITSSYLIFRFLQNKAHLLFKKSGYFLLTISFLILLTLVLIYPFFAVRSYFGELKTPKGLDGLKYLEGLYPNDYRGILWLRDNIKGQPVILEAQGDSYTDFARVSSNTGLPTIVGWPVHEWLWRGSYDQAGARIPEVQNLYDSEDEVLVKSLVDKYKIEYVFIGDLERQKYPNLKEEKFVRLGEKIFESGNTKIYKIK